MAEVTKKIKHAGGAPTKFKAEFIEQLVKFFDVEPYKKEIMETSIEYKADGTIKKQSDKFRLLPSKMPTLYRFSRVIGVDYSNVWRWAEGEMIKSLEETVDARINANLPVTKETLDRIKNLKQFRKAYKEAKELQKEFLINIGLAGAAPAPFAIFTAKNVTDMRDRNETDVTIRKPKPLLDALLHNNSNKETSETE